MESNAFVMHNGIAVPHPGFGTCKIPEEDVCGTVLRALEVGYRHFDTAALYGNEVQVGEGLRKSAFPREELSYEQAVAYLRREAIVLDNTHAPGFVLVTYQGRPLGFVKQVGNRANNLYPAEWRIRSGYLPEELRLVGWQ